MSQQNTSEGWVIRIGSAAGIVGAVLGMGGNLAHPATFGKTSPEVAAAIAGSDIWITDHLVIVFGLILMIGGLAAVYHAIRDGLAGALARLGLLAAIAGVTVGVILVGLDGIAAKHLADAWAAAGPAGQEVALGLVVVQEMLNFALAAIFNILFAGFTFILYGLAVVRSGRFPAWLGWVAVAAGIGSIGAGVLQAYVGVPTLLSFALTIIFPTIITLWLVAMNVLTLRTVGVLDRELAVSSDG